MNDQTIITALYRGTSAATAKLVAVSDSAHVAKVAADAIRDELGIEDERETLSLSDSTYGEQCADVVEQVVEADSDLTNADLTLCPHCEQRPAEFKLPTVPTL